MERKWLLAGLQDELHFVDFVHRLRTLGWILGTIPALMVLHRLQASSWLTWLLLATCAVWPHIAWLHSRRAHQPLRSEWFNMLIDPPLMGAWIAAMQFNLVPSLALVALVITNCISAGGWRLGLRALILLGAAALLVCAAHGFAFSPESTLAETIACIPLLLIYPIGLSMMNFRLSAHINRQNRRLEQLNRVDELTGLASRRHLMGALTQLLHESGKARTIATLILFDVDHFKQVNDSFGHNAGDSLLQTLARIVRGSLGEADVAGRLGGDEFCIVLPHASSEAARALAERIRGECESSLRIGDRRITLSLGIASLDADFGTSEDWLNAADAALYRAKANGRNQVAVAGSPEPECAPLPAT